MIINKKFNIERSKLKIQNIIKMIFNCECTIDNYFNHEYFAFDILLNKLYNDSDDLLIRDLEQKLAYESTELWRSEINIKFNGTI